MILTRFCSQAEYDKYMSGETLINTTDHYRGGKGGSTSVGFCFTKDEPKKAWRYLKGRVDFDVCLVLDIDEALLTLSFGKYSDCSRSEYIGICIKDEYCITAYSKETAKLLQVLKPEEVATKAEVEAIKWFMSLSKKS